MVSPRTLSMIIKKQVLASIELPRMHGHGILVCKKNKIALIKQCRVQTLKVCNIHSGIFRANLC